MTPEAVRHAGRPNQVGNLVSVQTISEDNPWPTWRRGGFETRPTGAASCSWLVVSRAESTSKQAAEELPS